MEKILYLCHRIPYPPNKGDKIRSYHWLQYLKQRYQVYLGAFIDDPEDWQYQDVLQPQLAGCHLVARHPFWHKVGSLRALFDQRPLSLAYYQSQQMQTWVEAMMREHPDIKVLAFSSVMAQFVTQGDQFRVMDFVDIDSDKWQQYADKKKGLMAWLYRREYNTLAQYEDHVASTFNLSLFVSQSEADDFQQRQVVRQAAKLNENINWVQNGVDLEYFDPNAVNGASPYQEQEQALVFTGAMDYWANIEGVTWFVLHVWPRVLAQKPKARFYIVGSNPSKGVRKLANQAGVIVTGRVPDVRPYLKHAYLAVAPLRISRGIQNKVLEALAMNKVVVGSRHAFVGIGNASGSRVADTKEEFSRQCVAALNQVEQLKGDGSSEAAVESLARHWVQQHFSWQSSFNRLEHLIGQAKG